MLKDICVWGKRFELQVIYDVYEGEEILEKQEEALTVFLSKSETILKSSEKVEQYCLERDGNLIGETIDDILNLVVPEALFIMRSEKKREVALLCNYKYDEENGIAILFENEILKSIGTQDDV